MHVESAGADDQSRVQVLKQQIEALTRLGSGPALGDLMAAAQLRPDLADGEAHTLREWELLSTLR